MPFPSFSPSFFSSSSPANDTSILIIHQSYPLSFFFVVVIYSNKGGWGEFGFICWGSRGFAIVSFLLYVNVSWIRSWSILAFKPLTLPTSWGFLPRWVGCHSAFILETASRFLAGNREAELIPTDFFFTATSYISSVTSIFLCFSSCSLFYKASCTLVTD